MVLRDVDRIELGLPWVLGGGKVVELYIEAGIGLQSVRGDLDE